MQVVTACCSIGTPPRVFRCFPPQVPHPTSGLGAGNCSILPLLVWHLCKEYIAYCLFQSVDELKLLLNRLRAPRQLVIKWHRKIEKKENNHYIAA